MDFRARGNPAGVCVAARRSRGPPPAGLVERRQDFLDALADSGNVVKACRESGFPRTSAYRLRKEDDVFAAAWADAVDIGNDALEDEAIRRAVEGTEEEI